MYKWLQFHLEEAQIRVEKYVFLVLHAQFTLEKKIFGHTLNVLSQSQGLEFEVNEFSCRNANATTIWEHPKPLSSFAVSLKVCSSTGIAAKFIGCGDSFLSCRETLPYIFSLLSP